ncbi:MAG: cbb3-type cytochrome oxidase assembly protein CcoS [Crocinitomicaceae bacterium]|jgi:cbb3-type cytochrome oxidase maturation protein|nr:cbb3-type cytochrome oxidase assembly protein CcoS [Crocinitomicaceae bacterium]
MGIIYIMLVVSLVVALFFLGSFLWAIKSGQYEDDYTPSVRILFEDELISNNQNKKQNGSTKI